MSKTHKNGATTAPPPDTAMAVPSFLDAPAGAGLEHMRPEDRIIPSVRVLHRLSPECKDALRDAEGAFINSMTKQSLGSSIDFTAALVVNQRIMMHPYESGNKSLRCRARDGVHPDAGGEGPVAMAALGIAEAQRTCARCPFARFGKANGKTTAPECTFMHNVAGYVAGTDSPVSIVFKSKTLKASQNLMSMASTMRYGAPPRTLALFAQHFRLTTRSVAGAAGQWWEIDVMPLGPHADTAEGRDSYARAKTLYEQIAKGEKGVEEPEVAAGVAEEEEAPF